MPVSAELKMLRFLQERVNKKTKAADADAETNPLAQDDYDKVSKKQARVKELMRLLAEKLGKENGVEGGQ
ncbi:MAG: hypothetical protein ACJA0V_001746 [Planctomycetota bacterium]